MRSDQFIWEFRNKICEKGKGNGKKDEKKKEIIKKKKKKRMREKKEKKEIQKDRE